MFYDYYVQMQTLTEQIMLRKAALNPDMKKKEDGAGGNLA